MSINNKQIGNNAELYVANMYEKAGYNVIFRNWRYKNRGEIDIILTKDSEELLVICEVKYRSSPNFALPCLAVNNLKQQRLRTLTQYFLFQNKNFNKYNIRFDIAEVTPSLQNENEASSSNKASDNMNINVIENAF